LPAVIFFMAAIDLLKFVKKFGCLVFLAAVSCQSFKEQAPDKAEHTISLVSDTSLFHQTDLVSRKSVVDFYAARNNVLFWSVDGQLTPVADSLIAAIRNANDFGLIAEEYHLKAVDRLLADTVLPDARARIDLLLTDGFLTLWHHLRNGRLDPKTFYRKDLSLVADTLAINALEQLDARTLAAEIKSREPSSPQYHLLKNMLASFQYGANDDSVQRMRAEKILLNMERWRWQKPWPDRYVFVNIPAFSLVVIENDSIWLETPVVVGKRETPTPVFESVIRYFTIYPYWHVPYSISTREILPILKVDATYLPRQNFEVLNSDGREISFDTIQWDRYGPENFPFVLRQREGSENSMGIIKFNFANNYNVFLHDTNSKRLYNSKRRDFSHGCVRVKEAVSLAHYLVREDDIYVSPEDLDQYLSLQQRLRIDLRKPIIVKLEYFTAEVVKGIPLFHDDIYKKDSTMLKALYDPFQPDFNAGQKSVF
jgi:L,D-transpeptidase YcbB